MIRLVASTNPELGGSTVDIFTSASFTHPGLSTTHGGISYYFNHDRGKEPNHVGVQTLGSGLWHYYYDRVVVDYGDVRGWTSGASTANTQNVHIYRIGGSSSTVRVQLFWFE